MVKRIKLSIPDDISRQELEEMLSSIPRESHPASDAQKEFAHNIGIAFADNITRGEIGELLDKKLAKMPPSPGQLRFAKELEIRVPWFCSYKRLSELIDQTLEEQNDSVYDGGW